jgi:hypothetical protein
LQQKLVACIGVAFPGRGLQRLGLGTPGAVRSAGTKGGGRVVAGIRKHAKTQRHENNDTKPPSHQATTAQRHVDTKAGNRKPRNEEKEKTGEAVSRCAPCCRTCSTPCRSHGASRQALELTPAVATKLSTDRRSAVLRGCRILRQRSVYSCSNRGTSNGPSLGLTRRRARRRPGRSRFLDAKDGRLKQ